MLHPGAQVGAWQVEEPLGRGSYGAVYRVRHRGSGLRAALKVLAELLPEDAGRIEREVRALSAIRHPNVVALHEHGRHAGTWYLVMELVEGETLEATVRREGPLPVERACAIVEALAQACEAVHRAGLVHRDIKPENVLIGRDGHARLIDFGLVRPLAAGIQSLTATGTTVGTPAYMSPEQVEGKPAGPPTDVYGLGGTLYFALSGLPPFTESSALAAMNAVLARAPDPPSAHRPGLPPEVERVCLRCLEKAPAARYPSAQALSRALATILGSGTRPRTVASRRAGPAIAALLLLGVGAAAAAAVWRSRAAGAAPVEPAVPSTATASPVPPKTEPAADPGARFKDPRIAEAVRELERGNGLERRGDVAGALAAFTRVIELAPDRAMGWINRGNLRRLRRDLPGARADLDRAVELEPRSVAARHNLGLVRDEQGDRRGALEEHTLALELQPDFVPSLYLRSKTLLELGDAAAAERDIDRAIEAEPENVECLVARGILRGQRGEASGALADIDRAIELDPRNGKGLAFRAALKSELGDLAGAIEDAERALSVMGPDDPHRAAMERIRARR